MMPELTKLRTTERALRHARENLPFIERTRRTILDLEAMEPAREDESAIVIAAGPSLKRRDSIRRIKAGGYRGTIVACDASLGECLRHGLVPDFTLTVDPHETRIVRWFGDPELETRIDDDYFRRQDLDVTLNTDELRRNRELVELVNRHGPGLRLVISTSSSTVVTQRAVDAGMRLFWWTPMYDDYEDPASETRKVFELTGVPSMEAGGNVGTAAWVFAHAVLRKQRVAVVGLDLGYPPDTPFSRTQYYNEVVDLLGDRHPEAFVRFDNGWYADPAYCWYREAFMMLAARTDSVTYNCTEGGTVFGGAIRTQSLDEFLERSPRWREGAE